jgi:non-heme chloroperoxidase
MMDKTLTRLENMIDIRRVRRCCAAMPKLLILLVMWMATMSAQAAAPEGGRGTRERFIVTTDGVRLHVTEAGPSTAHTILFIPGWTMPGWIWERQIHAFSARYHVVALDPRGQGLSDVPTTGYEPGRRGRDIADVVASLGPAPLVIVAWSLGVLDTLACIHTQGDGHVAGLVLVDNSVGEEPAPVALPRPVHPPLPPPHAEAMRRFVIGMFRHPQSPAWLDRLIHASLRTPEPASRALLSYPLPRTYWKDALYATDRPVLYVIRPHWAAQAANLSRNRPGTETDIFADAGHALFVDEPARFNTLVDGFIRRRVWP